MHAPLPTMAIIKLGITVVGIRGTIGGITFSQNKAGPYAKAWRKPVDPRTPGQLAARALLSTIPTEWRAITQAQRDAWDTWAALPAQDLTNPLGETYSISGFAWFNKFNTWGLSLGFTVRTAAPTLPKPAPPTILTATVQNTVLQADVTYASGTFGASDTIVVFVAPWKTQTALTPPNNFRFLRADFNPPATLFDFKNQYTNTLGAPIVSGQAFIRVYLQNTQRYRSDPTLIAAPITT